MTFVAWVGIAALAGIAGALLLPRIFLDPLFRRMLHPPKRTPRPLPEAMAQRAEDVTIAGAAMPMKAWLVRPVGEAEGIAVFVHGWSSDGGRMAPLAAHVVESGIACLLVDLPGHGRTGRANTYNARIMVDDLRRVRDFIEGRSDLASLRCAILGYSFGGVGAIVSACHDPRWQALVVMGAPVGPMQATETYLESKGFPARRLRGALHKTAIRVVGVDPDSFAGPHNLPSLRVPALFVHGTNDEVVPHENAQWLHASAPRGLAELVLVEGASHDGLLADAEAGRRVASFLARVMAGVPVWHREGGR